MNDVSIKDYILAIEKRPGMYLPEVTYRELINCISYFVSFKKMFNLMTKMDSCFVDKFPKWICSFYKIEEVSEKKWDLIIRINSNSDSEAFDNFFRLFRTFASVSD